MTHPTTDSRRGRMRTRRRHLTVASAAVGVFVALVASVSLLAGCGGSQTGTTAVPGAQSSTATRQILATVTRGDVVQTVFGRLELTSDDAKPKGTVQISGDTADKVAAGQSVTAMLGRFAQGGGQGGGQPSPPANGSGDQGQASPPAAGGMQGSPPAMGGGAGQGMPSGGMDFGMNGTKGTVLSVESATDGSVTATVQLDELPGGAQTGDQGMAVIQIEVLAQDVLVVPTQAITETDGKTTVAVLANGKTETRDVEVGAQGTMQSEIVSGLSEGDNIVYEIQFAGQQGGMQPSGAPGGQMGSPPAGAPTQE